MSDAQLKLFPLPKPLAERIDPDFFRSLPKTPGVYRMFDELGRLIYIGQSKNLRQRLFSYKNASPDRTSRKVRRLLASIRRIEFEQCPSPLHAQLRENELLREHRPRFNSMNVFPAAYVFVSLEARQDSITCRWTRERAVAVPNAFLYGAFKGVAPRACMALARLIVGAVQQIDCPTRFPRNLLLARAPREIVFPTWSLPGDQPGLFAALDLFFSGKSARLIEILRQGQPSGTSAFHQAFVAADLDLLTHFFRVGPRRNLEIQSRFGLDRAIIGQDELDDWIVRDRMVFGPWTPVEPTAPPADLLAGVASSGHSLETVMRA